MKIIKYKKHITRETTDSLKIPDDVEVTELATTDDGYTYVSVPDATKLPSQNKSIMNSVKTTVLTSAEIDEIKKLSPHIRLINDRVREQIRSAYDVEDELRLARIAIGSLLKVYSASASEKKELVAYQKIVEDARTWGRAEKVKLGL